MLTELESRT